jgi:hypothetical protein
MTDEWQKAIDDNKFIVNKKISKMFPYLKNPQNYLKLKIDQESHNYISYRDIADVITKIICMYLVKENVNPATQTIVDYTAGVGGNVLSFAKYFGKVVAIEIDELRASHLKNNADVYGYENVEIICGSSTNYVPKPTDSVIFIDPPWGGIHYKEHKNLTLFLGERSNPSSVGERSNPSLVGEQSNPSLVGDVAIEQLVTTLFARFSHIRFVVLKLPKNYDTEYFNNNVKNLNTTFWILKKMFLVVIKR